MQKSALFFVTIVMVGLVTSGCTNSRDVIAKASLTSGNDVFSEAASSEAQAGQAITIINFAVKSNYSRFMGYYNKHSNPPYRVNLNIDGQATSLDSEPILEETSPLNPDNPESGTGWKYRFSKRISLAPGKHKLMIVLPVDEVTWENEIDLRTGVTTITLVPIYHEKLLRPFKGQNFTAGVKDLKVLVK